MAWVYILQTSVGDYYVGSTTNIEERLKHHFGEYTPSTKSMGVEKLLLKQEYATLGKARIVEQRIKSLKRKDYIDKMVQDGYIKIRP